MGIEEKDFDRYVEHLKKIKTYPSNGELVFKHGKVVLEKHKKEVVVKVKEKTVKIKTKVTVKIIKLKKKRKKGLSKIKVGMETVREIAIKRDGYRCFDCGELSNLEVHHKIHSSNGGTDDLDNLITLCSLCHYKIHKGEPVANLMKQRLKKIGLMK